ncbi:serine hydrolase domain-containing protein [Tenacibaculum sp. ZS6-P6]|uniref:serine hydrolase domain-containing protein n=1 Tax=Tenacibaculum sp. ZS6-P6 TaxID=3447503 RepID=UPI003F97C94F
MRKTYLIIIITCVYSFFSCQEKAEKIKNRDSSIITNRIDSLFTNEYAQDRFQGGIVISEKGKIIYENYLGIADRTWGIAVDKNTKFDIASVNKSMIAALVLKAVEDNLLHLEDKLVDLLIDFDYQGDFHSEITLHHLLCHRSGIGDYNSVSNELKKDNFLKFKRSQFSNDEYVNFISKLPQLHSPNERFYYSNFAYHLLAILLEVTYKMPFEKILKEKLTIPLGLKNTISVDKNNHVIEKLAKAYCYDEKSKAWLQTPFIDLSLGRRIFSTPLDLNKWAQVIDNPGWLSKESLSLLIKNHQNKTENISYGYGWVVFDSNTKSKIGDLKINKPYIIHGGSTDGYKSILININKQEYVISFLSNLGNNTNEMALAQKIVQILI